MVTEPKPELAANQGGALLGRLDRSEEEKREVIIIQGRGCLVGGVFQVPVVLLKPPLSSMKLNQRYQPGLAKHKKK